MIAPSFSDIFYSNCTKNGLLPCPRRGALPRGRGGRARRASTSTTRPSTARTASSQFEIDEEIKHRLLNGLDDVAMTLERAEAIDAFEAAGRADRGPVTTSL